jgi:hypothetical protein
MVWNAKFVDVVELQACLFIFLNENSLIVAVWTASPIVTLHGLERRVCRRRRKAGVAATCRRLYAIVKKLEMIGRYSITKLMKMAVQSV